MSEKFVFFFLGIIDLLDTDDDNDNIPDHLDSDSDGDGIDDKKQDRNRHKTTNPKETVKKSKSFFNLKKLELIKFISYSFFSYYDMMKVWLR